MQKTRIGAGSRNRRKARRGSRWHRSRKTELTGTRHTFSDILQAVYGSLEVQCLVCVMFNNLHRNRGAAHGRGTGGKGGVASPGFL